MRKNSKLLIVLAFAVFAAAGFIPGTDAGVTSAAPTEAEPPVSARDLFVRNCARCHAVDGTGSTDLGRKLEVPNLVTEGKELSTAKITRVVTNGKDEMPSFGKKLTRKQIASLAAYVRKL